MNPHWVQTTVGQSFSVLGGGTPDTETREFWGGTVPWISSADIDEHFGLHPRRTVTLKGVSHSPCTAVPKNSVIVVTRVGLGKIGLVSTQDVCFSQDCQALLPTPGVSPRFVAYQMKWTAARFLGQSRGTTISGITKKQLLETPFHLPPSTEQSRIADALDDLFSDVDAGVVALEQVRQKLKLYRASVLRAALEGALTAEWRAQHPHTEPASELLQRILAERRCRWEEDQLAKFNAKNQEPAKNWKAKYKEPSGPMEEQPEALPQGWCWATLGQLFRVERGRFSVRPRNDPRYYGGDVPFVQIGDLPREGGTIRTYTQTLNDAGLGVSKEFPAGTMLIAIVGATIGNTGILSFASCCPDSLVAVQSRFEPLLRYAEFFLRTKKLSLRVSASASGGQPNINLEVLQPLVLPLPPQAEIEAIVDTLEDQVSVIDHLEAEIDAKLQSAQGLRQAILRHAFTGQLVPQDPNDEPASQLLKRIAAERATRAQASGGRHRKQRAPRQRRGALAKSGKDVPCEIK